MIARHRGEEIKLIQPTNIDTVFFERDKRYRTLIRELKSFDNPYVLFIESNEKVLNALRLIKEKRLSKRYERVILYMSEIYWIDGSQLTPSSFGETDSSSGIWTPIDYTGSYAHNSFRLEFGNTGTGQGSGKFASDTSGNANHLDTNNFSGQYQMTDTPTNNFCTMSPVTEINMALSAGATAVQFSGS